jgi:hypothetical protein
MLTNRLAFLSTSALLALASCGGEGSTPASDGGPEPDTGGSPGPDASPDSEAGGQPIPDSSTDSMGPTEDAADGAPMDGGACLHAPEAPAPQCFTMFAQVGPTAPTTTCMSGPLPQGQGGGIPDGIYTLETRAMYAASCSQLPQVEGTLIVCAGEWDWIEIFDPFTESGVPTTAAFRYTAAPGSGASVVLTPQCTSDLDMNVVTLSYTFAAGQLTLISPKTSVATTYTKK